MSVHRKMWLYAAVCALTVSGGGQVLVAQAQEVAATSSAQALVIAPAAATHEIGGDTVSIGNDAVLRADHQTDTLVSIFGSSRSDGEVSDSVVSVFGDTHVTGTVGKAVVAVFGNNYVNGHVGGDAVAVLGDLDLEVNAFELDPQPYSAFVLFTFWDRHKKNIFFCARQPFLSVFQIQVNSLTFHVDATMDDLSIT